MSNIARSSSGRAGQSALARRTSSIFAICTQCSAVRRCRPHCRRCCSRRSSSLLRRLEQSIRGVFRNPELLLAVWESGATFPHDVLPWLPWLSVDHDGEPLPWCERRFGARALADFCNTIDHSGHPA